MDTLINTHLQLLNNSSELFNIYAYHLFLHMDYFNLGEFIEHLERSNYPLLNKLAEAIGEKSMDSTNNRY